MIDVPINFLLGVATTASAIIGLFFVRFWRRTRDPLFAAFAAAFFLFTINWAMDGSWWENSFFPFSHVCEVSTKGTESQRCGRPAL